MNKADLAIEIDSLNIELCEYLDDNRDAISSYLRMLIRDTVHNLRVIAEKIK